jgi:hypothetical protein
MSMYLETAPPKTPVYNIITDVGHMYVLQVAVALGWMLCIGCLTALVYGLYDTHLDRIPAAAYSSLSHTAWAISLSWIVIACSTGYGGQRCYGIYWLR